MNSDELLKSAIANNKILDYFRGTSGYRIINPNGDISNASIQDFSGVIDSFHRVNKSNPEFNIPQIMLTSLDSILSTKNPIDIYAGLNILNSEVFKEKLPSASFKLANKKELLIKLEKVLIEKKAELSKIKFQGDSFSIWDLSQRYYQNNLSGKTL